MIEYSVLMIPFLRTTVNKWGTNMNLNQIKSFLSVSQTLNFTNAAKQNGVPQSTISRQINDLEQQLEVKLFYRTKRDVRLTEEGRTFLPYAQEILDAAQKGAYAVKQLHDGAKGRLTIATVTTSAFLTECLRSFGQRYPDIVVDITYISCGDALLDEGENLYDFHFLYEDMLPDSDEFDSIVTHTDNLGLVVPKGHRLSGRCPDASELQKERFILISEEENPILYMQAMNYCRTHRFFPNVVNQFRDAKSVILSVSAGLGISILPTTIPGETLPASLEVLPLDDLDASITCVAAWKKSLLNPAATLFLEVIRQQEAKLPPL